MATGINAAVVAGYALEQSRHIARAQIDVCREPVCINEKAAVPAWPKTECRSKCFRVRLERGVARRDVGIDEFREIGHRCRGQQVAVGRHHRLDQFQIVTSVGS